MFYTAKTSFAEHPPAVFGKQCIASGGRVDDIDPRRSNERAVKPRARAAIGDDDVRGLPSSE